MRGQVAAILAARFRILRNRFPQSSWATILFSLLSLIWYGLFFLLGTGLAVGLPYAPPADIARWLPAGLLGVFLFWQLIPLFTLSTGSALQLSKIQIYPVPNDALFGIEVLLRFTSSPEMIFLLLGALIGLLRNPDLPALSPLSLLIFIPINLFVSLAVREAVLHSFERNRFRELFAIFIVSLGILPQFLLRSHLGSPVMHYFLLTAHWRFAPWQALARASLSFTLAEFAVSVAWLVLTYFVARRLFLRSLRYEETVRGGNSAYRAKAATPNLLDRITRCLDTVLPDPLGALVSKELRSLSRMPRFRIVFGMACIFSVLIFVPFALNSGELAGGEFIANHFLAIVTLYGLLVLSDTLLLNAFGLDGSASQIYFAAPVSLQTALQAKNTAAILFILLQSASVFLFVALLRFRVTSLNLLNALASEAVVTTFFLAAGNLSSVSMPRGVDPRQTLRKQAGGKMQLWTFLCSLGMFALLGLAYLARWATGTDWASFVVLGVEFGIGCIVYWISLQAAVERGYQNRERIIDALTKSAAPV